MSQEITAAAPAGKTQKAVMEYLDRAEGKTVELTDMVRTPTFRGMHFTDVMSAAEALKKKGLIDYESSAGSSTLRKISQSSGVVSPWGKPYGSDPSFKTPHGLVWMHRKGQHVRFFDEHGEQVGPEQSNVGPAISYAYAQGWHSTDPRLEAIRPLAEHQEPHLFPKKATPVPEDEQEREAVSPPGWEKTVKKMKKHPEIDNPWALSWHMKNKGYTPGGKEAAAFEHALLVDRVAKRFASPTAKAFVGELGNYFYAIKIEGIDPSFLHLPFGRQMTELGTINEWKKDAKHDWFTAKPRKGQSVKTELKRWIKAVNPKEFYAKLNPNDDSHQIFYK